MPVLDQLPQGARVCIIRIRSLGDCVLTTPLISLLKQHRPDLHIAVVVEERFSTLFDDHPDVSAILEPTWTAVRKFKPDLCVNLHGGTRSLWMTALSGARFRAGFAHHATTLPYNLRIGRAQQILGVNRTVHTAEHLASVAFALGVPMEPIPPSRLTPGDFPEQAAAFGPRYAVIHAYAALPEKCWPLERFAEVARYLALWNITPVFLAGPDDDTSSVTGQQVFRGPLNQAKAVLSKAALFLGNDSGPAHMAAAFHVPSVVLFGPSKPAIWGPWRTESEIVVAPEGLANVPVSRVIAAVERLRILEEAHA
jgi:ADP-heptose:LPS heptosyltransferase